MYEFITSSLFQKKSCQLPGIGSLSLVGHPAVTDFVNRQIKAPVQKIVFVAGVPREKRFNEFSVLSDLIQRKLAEGERVEVPGAGIFFKTLSGEIEFEALTLDATFTPAVHAERVIREHSQHNILIGDKETTNIAVAVPPGDAVLAGQEETKWRWWIWALSLGFAGLLLLVYYFSLKGFNGIGNIGQP
jgi:nucleoid DNA-binding protein